MNRLTVTCTATRHIELRTEPLPAPRGGEVLIETLCSSISAGSELLIYRGEFTESLEDLHDPISSNLRYPHDCGYACTGRIIELGHDVERRMLGQMVFAFQPHSTYFIAPHDSLIPIPEGQTAEAASFLPNMETAINLVQDAAPLLGERALVLGQGVVGLLTASLLNEFPLETLVAADHYALRRQASPASHVLDSSERDFRAQAAELLPHGADLSIELSGSPRALNHALELTGFAGRVIIGSWYGEKSGAIDLGGRFHRSRITMVASQVSTIAPALSARWDKTRRFATAWNALEKIRPTKWITHRFPVTRAADAFQLLDQHPELTIQVIFDYKGLSKS